MTKGEAKIIGAYTGILMGEFTDMHEYIEYLLKRPVLTHELANKELVKRIKSLAKPDFLEICEKLT